MPVPASELGRGLSNAQSENLPNQPPMPDRIPHSVVACALLVAARAPRIRAPLRTLLASSGGHGSLQHRDRVVHEEFDSHGCETRRGQCPRAMRRRLMSEKEPGASNREPGNRLPIALPMPQEFRTERDFVGIIGSVPATTSSQQSGKVQKNRRMRGCVKGVLQLSCRGVERN